MTGVAKGSNDGSVLVGPLNGFASQTHLRAKFLIPDTSCMTAKKML